ncbi:tyrosine-type recombinase/integrase [Corynebacterium guangdongense]|uniref:Integrase n=1 Tax=Corynebacterium guangdongense TaxID=1783348 RepID=A0ABU1ZUY4_9CORY|nr:tyrosine-type recombinase/integrase [Corynebacterium guangdongense]MDR7328746.1 integrase [Corynebacterium guangdongense]WJZ17322.1 Phage integrase family protein [Corynebacterium guangdongense]
MTRAAAARTRLEPGESSIQRVSDTMERGDDGRYRAAFRVRLWDGRIKKATITAATKGEWRAKAQRRVDELLASGQTAWRRGDDITAYIDGVSAPAIAAANLRDNSRTRYTDVLAHLRSRLVGYTIADGIRFRVLEATLKSVAADHGRETGHQARTVLSKYVIDQLIRDELVDHNPLRGVHIDLGSVKKTTKPSGAVALSRGNYDSIVDHLLERDLEQPLPPGKDLRAASIAKHERVVALTLLQAGTGLRISEALSATWGDVALTDGEVSLHVSPDRSKTGRARTVPVLDPRVEAWLRGRHAAFGAPSRYVIGGPTGMEKLWRTDNAVKAVADLYKDMAVKVHIPELKTVRSHVWRTTLNNLTAGRVPEVVRAAFFGHDAQVNRSSYTDLTDVSLMRGALGAMD